MFVDSSFWIAEILPREQWHREADRLAAEHRSRRLTTSNLVVGETWTFLRRRAGHLLAMRWLDVLRSDTTTRIERVGAEIEDEAWTWLRVHDERPYSFVDATSFALMRQLRIREALAFDGDFASAGFVELRL
jgi:predicted nucleic acid-binding protein